MKTLILLLLLNSSTGDLDGYYIGGITENVATCHDAISAALKNGLAEKVPEGDVVSPICLDVSKIDMKGLEHNPSVQPNTVSHF